MNAMAIEGTRAGESGSHQPLYFPSGGQQLFGWLHHPTGAAACGWGVVVCKPFGYEALCAHRSVRAFADAAAQLGMPTLRFDYLGTGDSADIDPSADQVEAWTRDIVSAVAELRRLTGVSHVCLLGFRLGALLAALAAEKCQVNAIALVAPVLSGRKYLREARTAQLAAEAAEAEAGGGLQVNTPAGTDGGMEVSGYALSAATVASLTVAEIDAARLVGVPDILLVDRSDLPIARALSRSLRDQGVAAEHHELPGFVEMMLTAPQFATRPQAMLQATGEWLIRLQAQTSSRVPAQTHTATVQLALQGQGDPGSGGALTERPVFLAADGTLFGILTEPRRDEVRRRAVILLNTGADYHIGASRMYVSLARRWARRGYYVLRMDFPGLGDSRGQAGRPENDVFPTEAVQHITAATEYLGRYGIRDIALAGLCSGAYHALRAAVGGLPLSRVLMVNPANYFWDETMSLDGLQLVEVAHNPSLYRERIFSAAAWRRFLTGRVNVWRIVKIYLKRPGLALQSLARDCARALGIRLRHDLGRELGEIIDRGVRVVFVFARGEPGLDLLRIEAGSMIERLGERCRVRIIDSADHTFSRGGPRQVLEAVLSEELFARRESGAVGAGRTARLGELAGS